MLAYGVRRACAGLLALGLGLAGSCASPPAPPPSVWDAAVQARRPFAWRLEDGARDGCTIVVRAAQPLADDDADELDAVLTDWYNLGRLGAFADDPSSPGAGAIEAMGTPWQPARDTLAARFDLGSMGRLGFIVLLNALEGYHDEQAPLDEVLLCAAQPPPAPPPGGST